jgi:hypothetical protein
MEILSSSTHPFSSRSFATKCSNDALFKQILMSIWPSTLAGYDAMEDNTTALYKFHAGRSASHRAPHWADEQLPDPAIWLRAAALHGDSQSISAIMASLVISHHQYTPNPKGEYRRELSAPGYRRASWNVLSPELLQAAWKADQQMYRDITDSCLQCSYTSFIHTSTHPLHPSTYPLHPLTHPLHTATHPLHTATHPLHPPIHPLTDQCAAARAALLDPHELQVLTKSVAGLQTGRILLTRIEDPTRALCLICRVTLIELVNTYRKELWDSLSLSLEPSVSRFGLPAVISLITGSSVIA